jgi:hypothetical protein
MAVAEPRDPVPQLRDEVRVAVDRSDQHAFPVQVSEVGERLDEEVLALMVPEDSDADQAAADGLRRGCDPIDPWPGDMHATCRDREPGQQLLAGPFAGNHHARGRAEHDPFGTQGAGVMTRVDGGRQRHVQQDRHSYPVCVRQQLCRRRRGDEPVDQRGITVGDCGDDPGQVGAGARVRCGPRRGDGRDKDVPPGVGQAGADPPVEDVPASRPPGIVEPVGDYYMDPHDVPVVQSARATTHAD